MQLRCMSWCLESVLARVRRASSIRTSHGSLGPVNLTLGESGGLRAVSRIDIGGDSGVVNDWLSGRGGVPSISIGSLGGSSEAEDGERLNGLHVDGFDLNDCSCSNESVLIVDEVLGKRRLEMYSTDRQMRLMNESE